LGLRENVKRLAIQFTNFGIAGMFSILVNLVLTTFCYESLGVPIRISYAIGLISSFLINYLTCRKLIFKSTKNAMVQISAFTFSSIFFRGLEYSAFLLQLTFLDIPYPVAIILIHSSSFIIKFFYFRFIIFT
jgi:putative flippase GtrA